MKKDPDFLRHRVTRADVERVRKELENRKPTERDVAILQKAMEHAKEKSGWAKGRRDDHPQKSDYYAERAASAEETSASAMKDWLDARYRISQSKPGPRIRSLTIAQRAIARLLRETPNLKAGELVERLKDEGEIAFDKRHDANLVIQLDGAGGVLIEDLAELDEHGDPKTSTIKISGLPKALYRSRARRRDT